MLYQYGYLSSYPKYVVPVSTLSTKWQQFHWNSLLLLDVDAVQSEGSFCAYNKAVAHVVIK